MANEEKIAFVALDFTEKGGLAGSPPLWNFFLNNDISYISHDEVCGIAIDVFDSDIRLIERWERKIIHGGYPINPKDLASTCGLSEALRNLEKMSKSATLVVLNPEEALYLRVAFFYWRIKFFPRQYLDFLSYARGMLDAKKFFSEELNIDTIAQETQSKRNLRAKLDYCVKTYRALQKLPSETKPAEKDKDSDIWPDNGCCGCVGC